MVQGGIMVLDKPAGMTSQQAVTRVKRLIGCKKAGHSGTLDPDVTGVLPVFLESATRLVEYVMADQKSYLAEVVFGTATDTQDASGTVIASGDPSLLECETVISALQTFVGKIEQVPPAYSAVKVAGVRAYALARAGVPVALKARLADVHRITVLQCDWGPVEYRIRFSVDCGKGTYVRTICHDLGVRVGVPAHMASLVRTRSGPYLLEEAHSLMEIEELGQALLREPASAVAHLPALQLKTQENVVRVLHGAALTISVQDIPPSFPMLSLDADQLVRLHDPQGRLQAIYVVQLVQDGQIWLKARKVLGESRG